MAGGAPAPIGFTGAVVNQPLMSPDGARYLWWYPGPDGFGGNNGIWVRRLTVGAASTEGVGSCSFCVISHGWLGNTAIGGAAGRHRPRRSLARVHDGHAAEAPDVSGTCVSVLASDARGGIGFPSGNAAGTEVVAALTPGESTGIKGRIVRYSLANGAALPDVTAGTTDTTPVFSPEGDRVAFERDSQIVIKDLTGAAPSASLAPGVYPHWGGARTVVGSDAAVDHAALPQGQDRGQGRLHRAPRPAAGRCGSRRARRPSARARTASPAASRARSRSSRRGAARAPSAHVARRPFRWS